MSEVYPMVRARKNAMSQTQVWMPRELRNAVSFVEVQAEASMGDVIRNALVYYMEREFPEALRMAGLRAGDGKGKRPRKSARIAAAQD